ncbi:MAG: hypothetical protein E6H00_12435 [Bacillati bacterium ANGP1]|uniref:DNA 3'-5' helicase n=1 Tax=Candidatus Segetimicrobium genomatis TaxID=2569760 RepID=A0A537JY94_9BACT|nr:MAG: hypothetical protein E6H00_12435 [Terrabacteria group bacterium ANGP1]
MMAAPLRDEAARARIRTELDRNFVVEAGAGTGKTQLLVDRVESLVASGRARLAAVVAITFTEKAAAELRVKIRERIESRLHDVGAARERFRTALEDLEIAPISTIHAFAADLLRERPVEAGVDPAFTVADELSASLFRTEAWDRWLEGQKDAGGGALRELIECGVSLGHLRSVGDALLRYRDVVVEPWDGGPAPRDPLDWLKAAAPQMRACIAGIGTDCLVPSDAAADALRDLERTLDLFARLGDAEVRRGILSGLKLKVRGSQGNWTSGVLTRIRDRLAALGDDLEALRAAHAHRLTAGAVNWLRGYAGVYQALKAREGVLDFDDLLLKARDLLRDNREVRAYFQRRFDAILVDEFQDTDPLQAEVVFFLAEDGARAPAWDQVLLRPGKLFIVGDPKQSIYAFRRADIETYERAKEVLLRSGGVEDITANFRSAAPVLTAVNEIFQGRMRRPPDGRYQPDYVALNPSPGTRASDDSPALMLLYPGKQDPEETDVATRRRREAEVLAAFLRHHIDRGTWKIGADRRPARFGDVALLFRGMSDVGLYEDALTRCQIPYRVTSSRTFYRREEIGWLLNVLHAVEHPTDPVAVWGALRSPLFGCSDRDVYEFVAAAAGSLDYRAAAAPPAPERSAGTAAPESIAAAYAVLRDLHRARLQLSVPRMVEEVLARTHVLETFLLLPQGEQRVANVKKVVTLARALEESGILTFRAFVHWLRDMEEEAVDEAESPTVEEGDDVVRIMSIHAAKGLEFPIVVIPDLGRGPGGRVDHLLIQRAGARAAAHVGKVRDWPIQSQEYEALKDDQSRRSDAERLRVLYVAMTRAKDALILPVFPRPAKGSPKGSIQEDLDSFLPDRPEWGKTHRGWLVVDGEGIPRAADDAPPVRMRLPDGPASEADPAVRERGAWVRAREAAALSAGAPDPVQNPSALVDHEALRALESLRAALEFEPGGRALGALVHAVLAVIPLDRPDLAEVYAAYFAKQAGLSDAVEHRAVALVRAALTAAGSRLAPGARVHREVPFAAAGPQGVVEGAMDMVVAGPDGTAVIDFKTDAVSADQHGALRAIYSTQLEQYLAVVRRVVPGTVTGEVVFLYVEEGPPAPDRAGG